MCFLLLLSSLAEFIKTSFTGKKSKRMFLQKTLQTPGTCCQEHSLSQGRTWRQAGQLGDEAREAPRKT